MPLAAVADQAGVKDQQDQAATAACAEWCRTFRKALGRLGDDRVLNTIVGIIQDTRNRMQEGFQSRPSKKLSKRARSSCRWHAFVWLRVQALAAVVQRLVCRRARLPADRRHWQRRGSDNSQPVPVAGCWRLGPTLFRGAVLRAGSCRRTKLSRSRGARPLRTSEPVMVAATKEDSMKLSTLTLALLLPLALVACERSAPPAPVVIGVPGPAGAPGATGNTGNTGNTGSAGSTGSTGETGARGTTGSTGTTGSQGSEGTQRAPGSSGAGTTVIVVPPAASAPRQ